MTNDFAGFTGLTALVDGALTESGSAMLKEKFNVDLDNPSTLTEAKLAQIADDALQMDWLKENLQSIKEKLLSVINGNADWKEVQGEVIEAGWKAAGRMKKAEVKALFAENKFGELVIRRDHWLEEKTRGEQGKTENYKQRITSEVTFFLAKDEAETNAALEKMQGDPAMEAALAAWSDARETELERATMFLKYGSAAPSHPKFPGNKPASLPSVSGNPIGFAPSKIGPAIARANARAKDSIEFGIKWSGDAAKSVRGFASNFQRGAVRVGKFLGLKR